MLNVWRCLILWTLSASTSGATRRENCQPIFMKCEIPGVVVLGVKKMWENRPLGEVHTVEVENRKKNRRHAHVHCKLEREMGWMSTQVSQGEHNTNRNFVWIGANRRPLSDLDAHTSAVATPAALWYLLVCLLTVA